jgi:hypothetical protein
MPFSTPQTVFPTQRPEWADEQMAVNARTDHGHVLEGRNRTDTLGYLARMEEFRRKHHLDIPGASVIGTILFKGTVVDDKGRERPATPLESWSNSVKAGEDAAKNVGAVCLWAVGLFKKAAPAIDRIERFDWNEGAKAQEADKGRVERMGPQAGAHTDDSYSAYPRRPPTSMAGRAAATSDVPALPAPALALEDKRPKRIAPPPKGLPRPDRGQDR